MRAVCHTGPPDWKHTSHRAACAWSHVQIESGPVQPCTGGSEKSIERTFAPVERKVQELSFHGTFAPQERMFQELSLLRSECSKNFRSMELSHPWNVRSTNNFRADRAPVELSLLYLKKLWKAGKQCVFRRILANIRCCILEWKRCHVGLYNNSLKNHRLEQSKV